MGYLRLGIYIMTVDSDAFFSPQSSPPSTLKSVSSSQYLVPSPHSFTTKARPAFPSSATRDDQTEKFAPPSAVNVTNSQIQEGAEGEGAAGYQYPNPTATSENFCSPGHLQRRFHRLRPALTQVPPLDLDLAFSKVAPSNIEGGLFISRYFLLTPVDLETPAETPWFASTTEELAPVEGPKTTETRRKGYRNLFRTSAQRSGTRHPLLRRAVPSTPG